MCGTGAERHQCLVHVEVMLQHRPVAETEAEVLLFEPSEVINTGDAPVSEFTAPMGATI